MLETSARLLRLLALLQSRRYWTGVELSARLEVTQRTLRRDVARLRDLGYTVDSCSGAAGGYQLGRGASFPPLLLDDDEAMAVGIALRTVCTSAVSGVETAGLNALAKFENVLPERLRRRLNALQSSVSPLLGWRPAVDAAAISTIASACHDREGLRFTYRSHDGAEQERRVEPHQLVHTGSRWYLVAWDLSREDWRTFRLDRIQPPLSPAARFQPRKPPDGGFTAYVSRSVAYLTYGHRARVILHATLEAMAEKIPPTAGVLERVADDRCLLSTGTHSLEVLCLFLGMTGVDFDIVEPPELIEHLRAVRGRFGRAIRSSALDPASPRVPPQPLA
jgi:predicted DNA-binding transcriptional regulator YafY